MTVLAPRPMTESELASLPPASDEAGCGTLRTDRGNLPLESLDVHALVTGLLARTELTQVFGNPHEQPLEATYIFPLPDRAAVTALRMEVGDRVVAGTLAERGAARAEYERALAAGRRAGIAEEERPDVFTLRVGNIMPGERVTVRLTVTGPLPYEDGAALYRFPLVVAPRYVPGVPAARENVGDGWEPDTDAVPDASRVSPPVLLPGFPNPVRLTATVDVDAAGLPVTDLASSLHVADRDGARLTLRPGERVDRDLVVRVSYGQSDELSRALVLAPDRSESTQDGEGTFWLTLLPPVTRTARPRDVVVLLDRSGSMAGWKMVAARRAAARIVDSLTAVDTFTVLTFDDVVERPPGLAEGLAPATDRNRFRAVEHLARTEARGGTEMLAPLREATALLAGRERDAVLVLVTDGQVANEDQILRELAPALRGTRLHAVGIDRAVNAGFLNRMAALGGGRCELVESEDRLDAAATRVHRRVASPLLTDVAVTGADGLELVDGTVAPARVPDVFPGVALAVGGRFRGRPRGGVTVTARTPDGEEWRTTIPGSTVDDPAVGAAWARAHLRDLEDRFVVTRDPAVADRVTAVSLGHGVLCRFTAFIAVDAEVVARGETPHRVVQPVEPVSGWEMGGAPLPPGMAPVAMAFPPPTLGGAPAPGGPPAPTLMRATARGAAIDPGGPAAFAPVPFAPVPFASGGGAWEGAGPIPAADLLAQLDDEIARLRAGARDGERATRDALSDLGSRLAVLADGSVPELATALRELALRLAECDGANPPRGEELTGLRRHALDTLVRLRAEYGEAAVSAVDKGEVLASDADRGGVSASDVDPGGASAGVGEQGPEKPKSSRWAFWR